VTHHNLSKYVALGTLLFAWQYAGAQASPPTDTSSSPPTASPDNTKNNRQSSNQAHSADKQPNNQRDVDLVASIRRSVLADKNLSTDGHNVKIVSADGAVTLSGVVRSDAEKTEIGKKAASVAGGDRVANNLKVSRKE
jgi:hyperosmotically inducible protein